MTSPLRYRAGRYVQQATGNRAFVPAGLPPSPPLRFDSELTQLLSDADRALGRLDGIATMLPDPDLFVSMYVRHEAVLSSQIEGTQSTLEDILKYEAAGQRAAHPQDVEEVVNYVRAMNHGLRRLDKLPLSLRLIREIHRELLQGVRGADRQPGEFRRSQNWIGSSNCDLQSADFVPPPPTAMMSALDEFERFLHDRKSLPALVHCALAHAQFETIHPFLDGNGRVGRLLITLLLCEREILQQPLLYLSYYLKAHRAQYYDRLMAIRNDGNWEGWVKFFLKGVFEVSQGASQTARDILDMREEHRTAVAGKSGSQNALRLLDSLFRHPIVSVRNVEEQLKCSYMTARKLVEQLQQLAILNEITGHRRNRLFRYEPYSKLFERGVFPRKR